MYLVEELKQIFDNPQHETILSHLHAENFPVDSMMTLNAIKFKYLVGKFNSLKYAFCTYICCAYRVRN